MIDLHIRCPDCNASLRLIHNASTVAVSQVKRKCRCGVTWRILVKPLPTHREGIAGIHELTFVKVEGSLVERPYWGHRVYDKA